MPILKIHVLKALVFLTPFIISINLISQEVPKAYFDFQGKYLVSVSDADMVPSAYVDGGLGPIEGKDVLSIIDLAKNPNDYKAVEIEASNSVTGPPSVLAITPDGKYVIIIETRGQRPIIKSNPQIGDLPEGYLITVIDISNAEKPSVKQKLKGFEHPTSISINSEGNLVAVAFKAKNTQNQSPLVFYSFDEGTLSNPRTPKIPNWKLGDNLRHIEFHPTDNTLALLNPSDPSVSFVKVEGLDKTISLVAWGLKVPVEKAPYIVKFTPNGKYVAVNAIYADSDIRDGGLGAPFGSVTLIELDSEKSKKGQVVHLLTSRTGTGVMPEGLTISPNGNYIVTSNLERSSTSISDPKQGFFSSLTLISVDQEKGLLKTQGTFAVDAILPEATIFDNSSKFIAMTAFDHFNPSKKGGSILFWRIVTDHYNPDRIELVRTNYEVPVTRGAHTIGIVR
ncbi:MAG TPA: hypothetical protein ENH87_16545 [Pricia antarctica]|uniref:Lactonase, 7-bladed beta-propeller n=3 Tax=root TaxID=1 RepID=A0A831QSJ8_9FLAO|nr:hypothetical protein [Pricia antarctica]